tara:strand:- start:80 stop:307 length:228 start_codon:yes stop_codon:yes gene_type:complete
VGIGGRVGTGGGGFLEVRKGVRVGGGGCVGVRVRGGGCVEVRGGGCVGVRVRGGGCVGVRGGGCVRSETKKIIYF